MRLWESERIARGQRRPGGIQVLMMGVDVADDAADNVST